METKESTQALNNDQTPGGVGDYTDYGYDSALPSHTNAYIWEPTLRHLHRYVPKGRVLDAGCGNGSFCKALVSKGSYDVVGIDLAESGIDIAKRNVPGATFHLLSVQEDLVEIFGAPFDAVVSLEVIEHLYSPKQFVEGMYRAVRPGGLLIISTPYHGYLKNLALSATGKMDAHFTAHWEGGHIKFFSRKSLTRLVEENGFKVRQFVGCGRWPYLWKSMLIVAQRQG
ncbi:methyltransferase domain-containing protein [bacterium]|nr:methyltransferase domain-containing protein [bacterium]